MGDIQELALLEIGQLIGYDVAESARLARLADLFRSISYKHIVECVVSLLSTVSVAYAREALSVANCNSFGRLSRPAGGVFTAPPRATTITGIVSS